MLVYPLVGVCLCFSYPLFQSGHVNNVPLIV